jgi:F0F1-type ATP synthase assembly protein I
MALDGDGPSVIAILMGMKEDLGEIRANSVSMKESLEAHIKADAAVELRVKAMEMRAERQRGFFRAWQLLAVLIGTGAGYLVQLIVGYFKSKHP